MDKVYIQRILPPTPPQLAHSKKWQAVKVCGATAKRLDLDRLAAFCFLFIMVGLRLTKPGRSETSRALAASWRHSPPCGELRALRRSCGDDEPLQQWL